MNIDKILKGKGPKDLRKLLSDIWLIKPSTLKPNQSYISLACMGIHIGGIKRDITKKDIETEISHTFLASLNSGDKIIFQFTADDVDVQISTHGTFGDHTDSVTIEIKKIANL